MDRLVIQCLEPGPDPLAADEHAVVGRLRGAVTALPVTDVCVGWRVSGATLRAVRSVTPPEVRCWRWHPVFTDDGAGAISEEDLCVGPTGRPPPPFQGIPEFTFVCPNRASALEAASNRLRRSLAPPMFHGAFLDRVRWPSPSRDPVGDLACFCDACEREARSAGLDLGAVRRTLVAAASSLEGRRRLVATHLGGHARSTVGRFLRWRRECLTRAVARLIADIRADRQAVALDVFSPALSLSVGQDVRRIGPRAEWVKSMIYLDALGPASLPFELGGYVAWLEAAGDRDARRFVAELVGFAIGDRAAGGSADAALAVEMGRLRGRRDVDHVVGLDVVDLPGVISITDETVARRVRLVRAAGFGLAPSWDLRHIPDRRLAGIAAAWAAPAGRAVGQGSASPRTMRRSISSGAGRRRNSANSDRS